MNERRQNREAAFFRRCFLFILIAGLLGLTAGTALFIFEDVTLLDIDSEVIALLGIIWFAAGCIGLLATVVVMKNRFLRTMRFGSAALIVLGLTWSVMYVIDAISYVRIEAFLNNLAFLTALDVAMILFLYLVTLETRDPFQTVSRNVLAGSLLLVTLASLVSYGLLSYVRDMQFVVDWFYPVLTVWILVTAIGIGALQTVIRLRPQNRGELTRTIPARARLTMTCPACKEWQELPSGPARCDACGFRMIVKVEEPRCECGYLLFRLNGKVCPECGCPVEAVMSSTMGDSIVPPGVSS